MTNGDSHPEHETASNGASPNGAAPDAPATEGAETEARVAALEAEKAELKDRVLRALADMENLRRRTEKDVADARSYAVTAFARDMLGAADNLRRAIESVPAEAAASADGAFKALMEGIDLTERDLLAVMGRHGVKKVDPAGQKFDPHLHQAMFEAPDPSVPKGTVTTVMQPGFVIGERVLRPALVGVSTGGPKAEATTEAKAAE